MDCFFIEVGECYASIEEEAVSKEVKQFSAGGFFGERELLRNEPRASTVTARTAVKTLRLTADAFIKLIREREHRENVLRNVPLFETMTDEQIAKLAGVLERQPHTDKHKIIVQGDVGHHFYILEEGEAVATIKVGRRGEQEVKRYIAGDLFGENALLRNVPRGATITAIGEGACLSLARKDFEKKLGPLSSLKAESYLSDPRKLLSDFYLPGDARGPAGTIVARNLKLDAVFHDLADEDEYGGASHFQRARVEMHGRAGAWSSSWFAVYRPCSRDSIAKMLGRVGVGKGLNVKGKSSKKNRLSGFVPFLQISNNDDKAAVEPSPKHARTKIFYRDAAGREKALVKMTKVLKEERNALEIDEPVIEIIRDYDETGMFGLDVPEPLMKETYIMRSDISPVIGWETGRPSEVAFMNANLQTVRGSSKPTVVLYQFDLADAMNPLGLLVMMKIAIMVAA